MKLDLIALKDIDENEEFFRGTFLRKYNAVLNDNVSPEEDNFYDYMLVHLPWEKDMIMVNVTKNSSKIGAGFSGSIPINSQSNQFAVNKKGFQHTLGKNLKDWYILKR